MRLKRIKNIIIYKIIRSRMMRPFRIRIEDAICDAIQKKFVNEMDIAIPEEEVTKYWQINDSVNVVTARELVAEEYVLTFLQNVVDWIKEGR